MLWAGADARSMGPSLEEEYTNDPECYTTGLEQASYAGNVEVLKKLKPRAERDNLEKLLHTAAISGRKDAIQYLLEIGAKARPGKRWLFGIRHMLVATELWTF